VTTDGLTVGVLGAGAVGCYFGARLAQPGVDVTLVGRTKHVDVIAREGLTIMTRTGEPEVIRLAATTSIASIVHADVVLVTVKSFHTENTADLIAVHVSPEALVVSLQNGVDNAWRLRARVPHAVVPGVVYVSTEMPAPGVVQHNGSGRLVMGAPLTSDDRLQAANGRLDQLVERFNAAGVPCSRSSDIRVDLWTKLATNCAYNAISALSGLRYGVLASHDETRAVMTGATTELATVARADGVDLQEDTAHAAVRKIADVMPGALSSTAQDLQAGRPTEIDHINGYVVQRGRALGVTTPINQTLHALVKLAESARRT
jgi:2-dehydropantoate 2-reductase